MKLIAEIIGSRVRGYSPLNLFVNPSFTLLFIFTIFWKCFQFTCFFSLLYQNKNDVNTMIKYFLKYDKHMYLKI